MAYQYTEAAAGAPPHRWRPSCSEFCYSPWCSGSLLVWIALAGAGFTINGLSQLAIIGTVLLLVIGAFGAMDRPYRDGELVPPDICAWR